MKNYLLPDGTNFLLKDIFQIPSDYRGAYLDEISEEWDYLASGFDDDYNAYLEEKAQKEAEWKQQEAERERERKARYASRPPFEGMPANMINNTLYGKYSERKDCLDFSKLDASHRHTDYIWKYSDGTSYCTATARYWDFKEQKEVPGYVDSVYIGQNAPDKLCQKGAQMILEHSMASSKNMSTNYTHTDADDQDYEEFYLDNKADFENEDDAWEYLEDEPDEWD